MKRLVLVADDLEAYIELHSQPLKLAQLQVVSAPSLVELSDRYTEHREMLAAIIMDTKLTGRGLNLHTFIDRVKRDERGGEFTGILVAASNNHDHCVQMIKAGCTYATPKAIAAQTVLDHFGLKF